MRYFDDWLAFGALLLGIVLLVHAIGYSAG